MSTDPLERLGPIAFARILHFLPVKSLARAELVSSSWHAASTSNKHLWYDKCRATGVDEAVLVPQKHWDVPTYKSQLDEANWRASCLKAHAADAAYVEGRHTIKCIPFPISIQGNGVYEPGDSRYSTHHDLFSNDGGISTYIVIHSCKTRRTISSIEVPSTAYGEYRGGEGYAFLYEQRHPDNEGRNPRLYRTHSRSARLRRGYPKTPPPKRGGFEFVCEVPEFRHAHSVRIRVDREGHEDAAAILYAIHPDLVRICHLEDGMRIEQFPIDPAWQAIEVFMDDEFIYLMATGEDSGFAVYSRDTKELVLTVPFMPEVQTTSNSFLVEFHGLEDSSRPARWGDIPDGFSYTKANKNKEALGFQDCPGLSCTRVPSQIILAGDDMVFTQACDLFIWKDYRRLFGRILRSKVTCPMQRGRWFADFTICIQAPTEAAPPHNHWCLGEMAALKHRLVCAFRHRGLVSFDLRKLPSRVKTKERRLPDTFATNIFHHDGRWTRYEDYYGYTLGMGSSQVFWFKFDETCHLTFAFNDVW